MSLNGNCDEKNYNNEVDRSLLALICEPFRQFLSMLRNFVCCNTQNSDLIDGRISHTWRRLRNQIQNAFGGRRRNSRSPQHYLVNSYPRLRLAPINIEREYDMNNEHRGIAVIFNHENFEYETFQSQRQGTHFDLDRLRETLQKLDFDVREFTDLRRDAIMKNLKKVASMNHKNNDCLLIVILTHGELGKIFSRDEAYDFNIIPKFFTDENCPSLKGKPKLFFVQSCRGEKRDFGVKMQSTSHVRLKRQSMGTYEEIDVTTFNNYHPHYIEEMVHNPPNHADFLIVRSTMTNYVSFRNPRTGSWFIQDLCNELDKNAYEMDILRLLTIVNYNISLRESDPGSHKQILCISSMLTKLLTFHPKRKL
ncbi:hypothetical protein PVAND_013783 [Polypedilum vanderplanki]|uniref:Uncharacterized protein n=1 Tax=Polypedilum vanderplanki TaxID=319348 RepID=A0A9J6CSD2_POLVA|nr:hypothetical protein PVAND_013783 [Polypedilum vanderplanki]